MLTRPALFGITNSNRDYTKRETWGKNQFNSSFPAALGCYMHSKNIDAVYLTLEKNLKVKHSFISVEELYGVNPLGKSTFYSFETEHSPYLTLVNGNLPRIDLVTCIARDDNVDCVRGLEIKLTALPDEQTFDLPEAKYSCEIVVRPDTIIYLALSIAKRHRKSVAKLKDLLFPSCKKIKDWTSHVGMIEHLSGIYECIDKLCSNSVDEQEPLMVQPVWKTNGKSAVLSDNCLDMFVWSDLAFTRLFVDVAKRNGREKITRHVRSAIWLVKMLYDFCTDKKIDHKLVTDLLTYDTRNDKAFSDGGQVTHPYLKSDQLLKPRIKKSEIKNIILGGGEKMLSPERRFDAAILSTPDIFN